MRSPIAEIDVLILAGGLGSRLAGVLGDTPKVLAPVEGRPFLDYQLDYLAGEGVRKVVLSLRHRAEMVLAQFARRKLPLQVETVVEPQPLGTAGAPYRGAVRSQVAQFVPRDSLDLWAKPRPLGFSKVV
jgi:NDP-sugar pyrophosphorylase family protein